MTEKTEPSKAVADVVVGLTRDLLALVQQMRPYLRHHRDCAKVTEMTIDGHRVPIEPWINPATRACTCGLSALLAQLGEER